VIIIIDCENSAKLMPRIQTWHQQWQILHPCATSFSNSKQKDPSRLRISSNKIIARISNSEKTDQRTFKHCALAVVRRSQKFLSADPLPGVADGQNLISWRWSLPLPTNPVWWGSMHAISSYHGNRPTHTPQTGLITIHCAAARMQCN